MKLWGTKCTHTHSNSIVRYYNTQKCTNFNKNQAHAMVKVLVDSKRNDTEEGKIKKAQGRKKRKTCGQERVH